MASYSSSRREAGRQLGRHKLPHSAPVASDAHQQLSADYFTYPIERQSENPDQRQMSPQHLSPQQRAVLLVRPCQQHNGLRIRAINTTLLSNGMVQADPHDARAAGVADLSARAAPGYDRLGSDQQWAMITTAEQLNRVFHPVR